LIIPGGNYIVIAMARIIRKGRFYLLKILPLAASLSMVSLIFPSCSLFAKKSAVLWTDSPEILLAVEMFNASAKGHLLEAHFVDNQASRLSETASQGRNPPSLVVGRGLRSSRASEYFLPLDYLLGSRDLSREAFYPGLLNAGMREGAQVHLPVSFNLMLVLAGKKTEQSADLEELAPPGTEGTIGLEELRRQALLALPPESKGQARMSFSPRWPDEDFLFHWVQLKGADFREPENSQLRGRASNNLPLVWNDEALRYAITELRGFSSSINGSSALEDAFYFTYLFAPGYKNVESGRILFTAMSSAEFFALPSVTRGKFEFGYLAEEGRLAVLEDIRYAGIPRGAPGKKTAEAFLRWFFNEENQKALLEESRSLRLSETYFGIAGGFSSLKTVSGESFPRFYGDLTGKLPPEEMVIAPAPLPSGWASLYRELVLPWLREEAGVAPGTASKDSLEARLEAYLDRNPNLR